MVDSSRPLREGSYTNADGSTIAYLDKQTVQDARDLYAVLQELGPSGSSNLENDQIRAILTQLHGGNQTTADGASDLTDAQWGVLRHLTEKYAPQLKKLRASPDHQGQDYSNVAATGTGRVIRGKTK